LKKYPEYKKLDLPWIADQVSSFWQEDQTFKKSIDSREGKTPFVFYEGPPSANGIPGIHHVMSRTIKDIFCRYKTQKGYQVKRKAGWDTHGLPIELGVEKELGITKEDIGTKISVEDYNLACRANVMKYTDLWNKVTEQMGYWVDMDHPYITFKNTYIESVWWLLKQLYNKDLLYKGYTIQPFSPAAGTGLSSHELNQPGTYKNVKDTTVVAQFKIKDLAHQDQNPEMASKIFELAGQTEVFFLAWTTTPWTLPSNTALAVGAKINYELIETYNTYTGQKIVILMALDLKHKYFQSENLCEDQLPEYQINDKKLPFRILTPEGGIVGQDLVNIRYHQLLPYAIPNTGDAFKVIAGDFVTTEDGTGIVHIAPSFGGDDFKVARQNGIGSLTLVDKTGRFTEEVTDYSGEFVKEAYLSDAEKAIEISKQGRDKYLSVDERIAIKLKTENRAFKVEKYEHTYPHCWRTDKPILYYPLDSWFVKTTAYKEKMIELNNTIQWKPESTGTGRFGNWLENIQDWNLSRSRFWGIPLPLWRTDDELEEICIGSVQELKAEIEKSIQKGFMTENPLADFQDNNPEDDNYKSFDLHKPYIDKVVLVSPSGKPMYRESDLIDVWFDSGAMPYAQVHYPFKNKELVDSHKNFPADFIAEGVDQTRGWFYTLHAIASMVFDSVAYKTVISNGLVLDKFGNKMSKRLGNAVDPFITLNKYGPDATRWYMITNASPWDNLKFNEEGITEVQRKFFGTLYNTYSFFVLYANIDEFKNDAPQIEISKRPELDRWILSTLNTLILNVDESYSAYEPTKAGRFIEQFVDEHLSNWYIRLSRRRFWKSDDELDKLSAYQTLFKCLEVLSQLIAPIAPFFADKLYQDLMVNQGDATSVHLTDFPAYDATQVDADLEQRMELAQEYSSLVLSLRKKSKIKVRQPLQKIMIAILDEQFMHQVSKVKDLILSEVNVKELEFLNEDSGILVKEIKPDFKKLGPKYGQKMKQVQSAVLSMSSAQIKELELNGQIELLNGEDKFLIDIEDVEILAQDIPGWLVATSGKLTVALDITITEELEKEGLAREFINRIQNIRKSSDLDVTDRIRVELVSDDKLESAINHFIGYICNEILADSIAFTVQIIDGEEIEIESNIYKVKVIKAS